MPPQSARRLISVTLTRLNAIGRCGAVLPLYMRSERCYLVTMNTLCASVLSLTLALGLSACASTPNDEAKTQSAAVTATPAPAPEAVLNADAVQPPLMTQEQAFAAWKIDFTARAIEQGYHPELLAATIAPAKLRKRAIERDNSQPEFVKPVWDYIKNADSPARVKSGRAALEKTGPTFRQIEAAFPVPDEYLTAIWGLETAYGRIQGDYPAFDTISTLAFDGRRRGFFEGQLYALLDMLRDGDVRLEQLKTSWAGAMGMTQFMPTTFRQYAVDFDGNGNKNLWGSEADALASAANYLTRSGWRAGEPVIIEVQLVDDFDYSQSETVKKSVNEWIPMGVRPADGTRWPTEMGFLNAKLLVPAGHRGPKFLAFHNFDTLMRYNPSTSYVIGINSLAAAIEGRTLITAPWPEDDQPLSFEDKKRLQESLNRLGYNVGGVDGRVGPNTRRAIRQWQRVNGLPADGYIEQRLLARLLSQG